MKIKVKAWLNLSSEHKMILLKSVSRGEEMLYSSWIVGQESIFHELELLDPDGVINKVGSEFLSKFYLLNYGDKTVPRKMQDMTTKEVAEMVKGAYVDNWNRLQELYILHAESAGSETIVDETYIDVATKIMDNANTSKVTGYNDDTFINDDSNDSTANETSNSERDKQYSQKKNSLQSIGRQITMVDSYNITRVICLDVSKIISLSIY